VVGCADRIKTDARNDSQPEPGSANETFDRCQRDIPVPGLGPGNVRLRDP
jgi:hypothetical protein